MNKLTENEKQSLCDFYGWRDCQVDDGYVTAIEDAPKNPENAGMWINAGQLVDLLAEMDEPGEPADPQSDDLDEALDIPSDSNDAKIIADVLDDAERYEGLTYETARIIEIDEFEKLSEYWNGCRQMTTASGIEYAEIGEDADTAEIIILRK